MTNHEREPVLNFVFEAAWPMTGEVVNAASKAFKKALIERALGAELGYHLGYPPGAVKPEAGSNQRNGTSGKTVLTEDGPLRIELFLIRCTMHVCSVVAGNTAPSAPGMPLKPSVTAIRFIASFQLCAARPQSAVMLRSASQISFVAASSLGKCPRDLMTGRYAIGPGWTFLTGAPADIDEIHRKLGFYNIDPQIDAEVVQHTGMVRMATSDSIAGAWCRR